MKEIILSNGTISFVSDEDYDYLMQWLWSASSNGRAHRVTDGVCLLMHHGIAIRIGLSLENEIDHFDRNYLNNQRSNLRVATKSQNQANALLRIDSSTGYKGVNFHKGENRWVARIQVNKTRISLGYFATPEEAAKAYDNAARRFFGQFANTNFKE